MNIDQEVWDNREKEEDVLARLLPGQHFHGAYYEDGTPCIVQDKIDIRPIQLVGKGPARERGYNEQDRQKESKTLS